jgi:hypothetical protein
MEKLTDIECVLEEEKRRKGEKEERRSGSGRFSSSPFLLCSSS